MVSSVTDVHWVGWGEDCYRESQPRVLNFKARIESNFEKGPAPIPPYDNIRVWQHGLAGAFSWEQKITQEEVNIVILQSSFRQS